MPVHVRLYQAIVSAVVAGLLVFYLVPLIVEGLKPETGAVRAEATGFKTVVVLGHAMAYRDFGEGRPLILVHGFSHSTLCWERNIEPLVRAGFRVLAVDLFGHGLSDKPYGMKYTLRLYADQVLEFMRALRVRRAHLAGHSMGGAVVLKFASMYPASVDRIVLIGSAGARVDGGHGPLFAVLGFPLVGEFFLTLSCRPVVRRLFNRVNYNNTMNATGEYIRRYMLPFGTRGYSFAFLRILRNFGTVEWQVEGALRGIANPVLLIHGRADAIVPFQAARPLRESLENSELMAIAGGPHSVMETHAVAVNTAMVRFLR